MMGKVSITFFEALQSGVKNKSQLSSGRNNIEESREEWFLENQSNGRLVTNKFVAKSFCYIRAGKVRNVFRTLSNIEDEAFCENS